MSTQCEQENKEKYTDMKRRNIFIMATMLLTMGLTACHDDEVVEVSFKASLEQPTNADSSKVYLQDERYVYWELGDRITIFGDAGEDGGRKAYTARLVDANNIGGQDGQDMGFFNGVFVTTMPWGSQYFLGLYPHSEDNAVSSVSGNSFGTVTINLPAVQTVRSDAMGDMTFNKNVFPMVAWYGGNWTDSTTAYNLDFHSVASIVRVQLFNTSGEDVSLDSIVFTSRNNATQLSGPFTIENYKTEDPNVRQTTATEKTARVTVAALNNGVSSPLDISLDNTTLKSFYLVLPAYKGRHQTTTYQLTMTVHAKKGGEAKTFSQNFTVATRRNGITYMRAIAIGNWESATLTPGLVGNGTAARPFKVYTRADLVYLRDCYNSGNGTINNQTITEDTYIRIMRSDIALSPSTWTEGIYNFKGHISYTTTGNTSTSNPQGIVNNSGKPLFNTITSEGYVEGIPVICDTTIVIGTQPFSPLCLDNHGEIVNCYVTSRKGEAQGSMSTQTPGSSSYPIAGICINNHNLIKGCGCMVKFSSQRRDVAGICYANHGTIQECYTSGPMTVTDANSAAGICYTNFNDGTVKDCYFSSMPDSVNFNWGGLVYTNQGRVEHCYVGETSSITSSGGVGGIVYSNEDGGTIDYCWSEAALKGNGVGQIAARMTGGTIVNCFCNNSLTTVSLQSTSATAGGGGLVGEMSDSSTLANSFAYINKVQRINNMGSIGALVGVVNGTAARIKNCYTYETAGGSTVMVGTYTTENTGLFENCYIVAGSQSATGLTTYAATSANFGDINTALNDGIVTGSGWASWQQSGDNPPTLAAYTTSKK